MISFLHRRLHSGDGNDPHYPLGGDESEDNEEGEDEGNDEDGDSDDDVSWDSDE